MKAVLSNRIYMSCSRELQEKINNDLTYAVPNPKPNEPPIIIKNMAQIRDGLISIPIGRTDLIPPEFEDVDKRILVPHDFPEFNGTLRESQQHVCNIVNDNAIINAWVSWGKTFTGLAIAKKLQQKTLVITHTIPLRNQWEREIKKVFNISPAIIGSGRFETEGPIVVGNVQTLYRNINKIQKMFGTIILDEMHHVSAQTFARLIDTNHARYKIGLSGTIIRKDGKHVVFRDYFGNHVIKPKKENYMIPVVHIIRSDIRFMDGTSTPWANRVSALTNMPEYQHFVSILSAAYAAKGHKVLVVSDRVAFLKNCAQLVGESATCIVGEVEPDEREKLLKQIATGEKNIIFGTRAIFSEGISQSALSCLILTTPINNEPLLEQLIGRILREQEGKLTPVIVDIYLKGNTARRQASGRIGYYMKQGYNIKEIVWNPS